MRKPKYTTKKAAGKLLDPIPLDFASAVRALASVQSPTGKTMTVTLNHKEMEALFRQDPAKEQRGGFQRLLVKLQKQCNPQTGEIKITGADLTRIPQYAFDYSSGGWQDRLTQIFSRILGRDLGR